MHITDSFIVTSFSVIWDVYEKKGEATKNILTVCIYQKKNTIIIIK